MRLHGKAFNARRLPSSRSRASPSARTRARRSGAAGPGRATTASRNLLDAVYGWTVGYGYRPSRVLWLLMVLLILVTASLTRPEVQAVLRTSDEGHVFTTDGWESTDAGMVALPYDACGNGRVRCFNPVLYAIDTVVPLIELDQRSTWYPDHFQPWGWPVEWWLNFAAVAGWVLSSIFPLSFARLARST